MAGKKTTDRRVHLGNCSVDGGILYLVDPCYIDSEPGDIAANLFDITTTPPDYGGEGEHGVAFRAGFGDGTYPVYGVYGPVNGLDGSNWIKRVEVVLIDGEGRDDESYEDAEKRYASGEGRRPFVNEDRSAPALRAQLARFRHLVSELQESLWRARMHAEETGELLELERRAAYERVEKAERDNYYFGLYAGILADLVRTLEYHQEKPWPLPPRKPRPKQKEATDDS